MLSDLSSTGGMMSSSSSVDTVNGKTTMNTLDIKAGSTAQLRFINASADNAKKIDFPFDVEVVARDGYSLSSPEKASSLTLYAGQRAAVEIVNRNQYSNTSSSSSVITKTLKIRDGNASIPVKFEGKVTGQVSVQDPFVPAKASPVDSSLLSRSPDFTISLAAGSKTGMMSSSGMTWSMNGQVYPDTGTMDVKVGQSYKVEFVNAETGMMATDHPIHIHGAHFQVVAVNGHATNDETWYDTYPMKSDMKTDIAVKFDLPGVWMIYCHILAHEDGGMIASFRAS